jgi:hypothetical protein
VELSTPAGEIFYTADGTDPRAPGGEPAKAALAAKSAIELKHGATIFARVRQENRWSGPLIWRN